MTYSANLSFFAAKTSDTGAINSGIDGVPIGANTASTGKFTSVTNTGLTSGRIPYASTGGLLADSAGLTYDATGLETTGRIILRSAASPTFAGQIGWSSYGGTYIWAKAGSGTNFVLFDGVGNDFYTINGSYHHVWAVSGTTKLTLTGSSLYTASGVSVGIGASDPNYQLHVTTSFAVGLTGFNQQLSFTNDTIQSLLLGTGYSPLKLNPLGGSVGIGTSSPDSFTTFPSKLVVGSGTGNQQITVYSGTSSEGNLIFADGTTGSQQYMGLLRYDHADNAMKFYVNGGTEAMRIKSNGNVVVGDGATTSDRVFTVDTGGGETVPAVFRSKTGASASIGFRDNSGSIGNDYTVRIGSSGNALVSYTSGEEKMRINSNGQLGVGTTMGGMLNTNTTPGIFINGVSGNQPDVQSLLVTGAKIGFAGISSLIQNQLCVYDSTGANPVGSGGAIVFGGNAGGGQGTFYCAIESSKDNGTAGDYGASLRFYTRPSGSYYTSPNMMISSAGNVGIGTTSPTEKLMVVGPIVVSGQLQGLRADSSTLDFAPTEKYTRIIATGPDSSTYASIIFATTTTSTYAERMRITSEGNVGIGTTSPDNNGGYKALTISGTDGGGQIYWKSTTYSVTAYAGADSNGGYLATLTNHPLILRTNNTERMRIDSAGNIGIGTSSPSTYGKVAIVVTGTATPTTGANVGPASINLYNGGNGGTTNSTMGIFGWHAGEPGLGSGIGFSRDSSGDWAASIRFYTHPSATSNINAITERMRITGDGNVGIGTDSPGDKLDVQSVGTGGININNSTAGGENYLRFRSVGVLKTQLTSNYSDGNFYLYHGGVNALVVGSTGKVGIGTSPNYDLQVYNNSDVWHFVAGGATGQVRIGGQPSGGGVIGAYAPNDTPRNLLLQRDGASLIVGASSTVGTGGKMQVYSTSDTLYVQSNVNAAWSAIVTNVQYTATNLVAFQYGNVTNVGAISTNGTGVTYGTASDYRLKENIVPITGALATVSQLKPVTYKWKSNGSDGQGFIAHELQAVVPDAVHGEKDAVDENGKPVYQNVDTSHLIATLTSAIQEQQALIESLTTRLTALENK